MHNSNSWLKWLLLAAMVAFSVLLMGPKGEKIRFGLDIQGGYSFTVELDREALEANIRDEAAQEKNPDGTPKNISEAEIQNRINTAVETANETAIEVIRTRIDSLGTEEPVITRGKNGRIYVQMPGASEEKREQAERLVRSAAYLKFCLVPVRSAQKAAELLAQNKAPAGFRITEYDGQKYYERDSETFDYDSFANSRELRRFGNPDPGTVFMLEKHTVGNQDLFSPIFVSQRELLSGKYLSRATVDLDPQTGRRQVGLRFDREGARIFADITGKYCPNGSMNKSPNGRQLAIILDDIVYSAPVINQKIEGGNAVITGNFDLVEANMLKNALNAGALPAPLKFIGKRFVNPTLGEDAISSAKLAIVWGCLAILVFLAVYYRAMGLVAGVALVLNIILLPLFSVISSGILGVFAQEAVNSGGGVMRLPVLTLPGVAGILLTIGMAVDANVLIYERTREEQDSGRPAFPSIIAGYDRAFLAILDGNLTTIITAIILFIFGTGLIRGFSVTLVAGILASMFTALVVTKMIFRAFVPETRTKKMKMMQMVPSDINIPFCKYFKQCGRVSLAIIVVTISITVVRAVRNPADIFAVDFTGGAKVSYTVDNELAAPLQKIREAAEEAGITDAAPQYQHSEGVTYLEIKTVKTEINGKEVSSVLTEALKTAIPEAGFNYIDVDSVGSQIGKEMKNSAYIAIALSTIAMLLYITLRFEFGFALGAIVALIHDVFITVGIFSVLGFQFNLTIVAALLTIVGYGVNDTIVLFDRIREELKRDRKDSFMELTNRCINVTLSRTILTSLTTLITVASLMIFTTGDIFGFAVCMLIGLIVSTYSTIFIASPVMLAWYRNKRPAFEQNK